MRLVDQADVLTAVDAVDEPELPQRTVSDEHLRHQALGQLEQLTSVPRRGQRGEPHVVGDVEAVVVDPHRPAPPERYRHHPLAEPRDQLEARRHQRAHVVETESTVGVVERSPLEHGDRTHVHGRLGALEVEEALVERGQAVVAGVGTHRCERMGQTVGRTGPRHEVTRSGATSSRARSRSVVALAP